MSKLLMLMAYYTLHTNKITDQLGVIDNEHLYGLNTYSPHRNINIIEPGIEMLRIIQLL